VTDRFPRVVGRPSGIYCLLGRAEVALIYELRQEGVRWQIISAQFGMSVDRLMRLMQRCRNDGLSWLKKP
jgi:hypothetical protein